MAQRRLTVVPFDERRWATPHPRRYLRVDHLSEGRSPVRRLNSISRLGRPAAQDRGDRRDEAGRRAAGEGTRRNADRVGGPYRGSLGGHPLQDIELEGRLAPSTRSLYERDMRTLVEPSFADLALREITVSRVDRFLKKQAQVSYARAKHAKVVLGLAMDLAVR